MDLSIDWKATDGSAFEKRNSRCSTISRGLVRSYVGPKWHRSLSRWVRSLRRSSATAKQPAPLSASAENPPVSTPAAAVPAPEAASAS